MNKLYTLILLMAFATLSVVAQTGLVINEVDYDQPGVDSAEFIELYNAGSAPINLGSYTVVLFNGNSTSNSPYDSFPLPAQNLNAGAYFLICSGSGFVANCNISATALTNMIQNGPPDAIGIRNNQTSALIDVLSYEGSCIAPWVEGTGLPIADSDTIVADSLAGEYLSVGRYPDGNDSNDNSVDFRRMCTSPGAPNVNVNSPCPFVNSVNEQQALQSITVYPNPSRGLVSINLAAVKTSEVRISLFNVLGNEIRSELISNHQGKAELDLSELQNGIYLVKVTAGQNQFLQRVILRK